MTSGEVHVSDQQALVIELMQALESGVHGAELRRFFHDDAEQSRVSEPRGPRGPAAVVSMECSPPASVVPEC